MASTRAEKEHMARVAALGCILCGGPAEVHHITGAGMGLRASAFNTIPLCPYHHRTGPAGEAVHNCTKTFEAHHGTQKMLLEKTQRLLQKGN